MINDIDVQYLDDNRVIAFANIETKEDELFDNHEFPEVTLPDGKGTYISWGAENLMPYGITSTIGTDEVLSQNMLFNIKVLYGMGVQYQPKNTDTSLSSDIQDFLLRNKLSSFFLEQSTDMNNYFFSVALVMLNNEKTKINRIVHLDACNVRFEKADNKGKIKRIFYSDWKSVEEVPIYAYPLLDMRDEFSDLQVKTGKERNPLTGRFENNSNHVFAIVSKFPTPGYNYYPTPYYLSVFKSKWFEIKQLVTLFKVTKLKNSAALKYLVKIDNTYWNALRIEHGLESTDPKYAQLVKQKKEEIKKFITGIENSGKTLFTSTSFNADGREVSQIQIERIDIGKEGGDYTDENVEAINMLCYAMGVHPNMVGAVPGKAQANNSGSDKRELFALKQILEASTRDIMLHLHRIVIKFNGWDNIIFPTVPMAMPTTLDSHADSITVTKTE